MAKKKSFFYRIRRKGQVILYDLTTPEFCSKLYCLVLCGYLINLKKPKTFTEKMQWLKLYEWPYNEMAIKCGDKFTVRSYLEERGLGEYLNELYDVWEDADEIDFGELPNQFVLKVTAGCGYNIICSDKGSLDISATIKQLKKWMKEDFGKFNAEPHYSKMKPRIICEKYLGENMVEYKYYIFNGKCKLMFIGQDLGPGRKKEITHLDEEGNITPFQKTSYPQMRNLKIPVNHEIMKKQSEQLADTLPLVRVDWFEVNGRVYFGEMTFTPAGGTFCVEPKVYDAQFGEILDISREMKKRQSAI